jgi:hypothetical protein
MAACRDGNRSGSPGIAFLEGRRVLYAPEEMEVASHCVQSVIEIRHRLSDDLGRLDSGSELVANLRAMRAAKIAAAFRLDVEDRLASILPANDDAETGGDDRLFPGLHL